MNIHRILSGSPEHKRELIAAGIFVGVWFLMDVVQFVDWVQQKVSAPPAPTAFNSNCKPMFGTNTVACDADATPKIDCSAYQRGMATDFFTQEWCINHGMQKAFTK